MNPSIEWISQLFSGREKCTLEVRDDGFLIQGEAKLIIEEKGARFAYTVSCDPGWRTRSAEVLGTLGPIAISLSIEVKKGQVWVCNGREQPQLSGCIDIDLGFTPATNTLPIRRLAIEIGEEEKVEAAWLKLPELELVPLVQYYRRVTADQYFYRSENAGSTSPMTVNHVGLVTTYGDLWRENPDRLDSF